MDNASRGVATPIQTTYLGFRFRSRLEARWACLFACLGIEFWYEPEGFRLSSGDLYLPDFYLPDIRSYAEVKPIDVTAAEYDKASTLMLDSRRPVLLLVAPPDFRLYDMLCPQGDNGDPIHTFASVDIDYHGRRYYRDGRLFCSVPEDSCFRPECEFSEEYRAAVYKSRGERFGVHG